MNYRTFCAPEREKAYRMDTTLKLPQESVLVQAGDGDIANLVVQTVSRRVDLGVGGGVTGVEALSGRFFPKHFLCGSDLRRQIGLLTAPPAKEDQKAQKALGAGALV